MSVSIDFGGYACPVEGLGPGRRLILWVRGCTRGCPGCIAVDLKEPGNPQPVGQVAAVLRPLLAGVDGMTISGGEPFEQAKAITELIRLLRQEQDVEVLVYTGCLLEELQARPDAAELLAQIDILIDGAFVESAPMTKQWRGSDNQRVHLLSARAQKYAAAKDSPAPEQLPLQVQVLGPSRYRIVGIPRRGDLAAYRVAMAARGIEVRPDE